MKYRTEWSKLSKKILQERPNCELCKIRGIDSSAEQVHHAIKPDKQLEADLQNLLLYDRDNLVAVCEACHTNIHKRPYYVWPEQRLFIDNKKNEISQKYLDKGKIVIWTNDLHPNVRKNKFN